MVCLPSSGTVTLGDNISTQSIRSTLKPAYGLILRERRRYFRCPISIPVTILETKHAGSSLLGINISEGRMAVSRFRSSPEKACRFTSLYRITKDHSWQNQESAGSNRAVSVFALCLFRRNAKLNYGLPLTKAGRDASGIRCREIPEVG